MLNEQAILESLRTVYFGHFIQVLPEVESTNTMLREQAQEGAPEGTVIITDFQSGGRGRRGRIWESEKGKNILMSLLLRPKIGIDTVQTVTLACGSILANSIEHFVKTEQLPLITIQLKWPNDLMVNRKKLAGILTESSVRNNSFDFIIVGMGINVNQDPQSLSEGIRSQSTSLAAETGRECEREKLVAQILNDFERSYIGMERGGYSAVIPEWRKKCMQIGQTVIIEPAPGKKEKVTVQDISAKGALICRSTDGQIREYVSGSIEMP